MNSPAIIILKVLVGRVHHPLSFHWAGGDEGFPWATVCGAGSGMGGLRDP